MTKKRTKAGPGKELRLEALKIYLSKRGNISQQELGRLVGRDRKTVNRWASEDKWDMELKKLTAQVTVKAAEKMAATMADLVAESFKTDLEFLRMTDKVFSAKL